MTLLLVAFAILLVSVPLAGGDLRRCADLRARMVPLLLASLLLQFLTFRVLRSAAPESLLAALHVTSYLLAGGFIWANRRIPGLLLMALGGAANFAAIAANGGVMPASPEALATAGKPVDPSWFANSGVVENARLAFFGDIFAVPEAVPFANAFSIGDILLVVGAVVGLHRICQSRLVPSGAGEFVSLRGQRAFMRVWSAQIVSNLGDWSYALAVASQMGGRDDAARVLATLLIMQVGPAGLTGLLGGPLVDRLARRNLMVAMDVVRAAAVLSLFLAGNPSLAHLYGVASVLGIGGAMFQPALQASIPNLVRKDQIVAANALVAGTFNFAVMLGPIIGGLVAAQAGLQPAFALNAATFTLSALLIARVAIPQTAVAKETFERPVQAVVTGVRFVLQTPVIRGVSLTILLVVFAAAIRSPLEPMFIIQSLGGDATALGLAGGAWGMGMLLGSVAAPAAAGRWRERRVLIAAIALVGGAVFLASWSASLPPVLLLWVAAGVGNAAGTISYESLLMRHSPDHIRGRVMAATDALFQGAFLTGALAAGWLGSQLGTRPAFAIAGAIFLVAAVVCRLVLRDSAEEPPAASSIDEPSRLWVAVLGAELETAGPRCRALLDAGVPAERARSSADLIEAAAALAAPAVLVIDGSVPGCAPAQLLAALDTAAGWSRVPILALGEDAADHADIVLPRYTGDERMLGAVQALCSATRGAVIPFDLVAGVSVDQSTQGTNQMSPTISPTV